MYCLSIPKFLAVWKPKRISSVGAVKEHPGLLLHTFAKNKPFVTLNTSVKHAGPSFSQLLAPKSRERPCAPDKRDYSPAGLQTELEPKKEEEVKNRQKTPVRRTKVVLKSQDEDSMQIQPPKHGNKGVPKSKEHKERLREAALKRELSPEARQRLSQQLSERATGRVFSAETRQKMSATRKAAFALKRSAPVEPEQPQTSAVIQQLKRTLKGQLKVDKIPEDLLMEKAVMEVVRIRKLILNWQAKYRDDHGHKPDLETTKAVAPQIYDLVVQFAALQDYVRNGDSGQRTKGEPEVKYKRMKSSKYKGVSWHSAREKWTAVMWDPVKKKTCHLGSFESEEAAARAYQHGQRQLAQRLHADRHLAAHV